MKANISKACLIISFVLETFFVGNCQTKVPSIQWQKSLGGSVEDIANSIQQTNDGGYIIAGSSKSVDGDLTNNRGGYDFWVVKLNNLGTLEWQKSYGGSNDEIAFAIKQTKEGGFIVVGTSNSNNGDVSGHKGTTSFKDIWVVKLTASGNIEWQKSLGFNGNDNAYDIIQTQEGGYFIVGNTFYYANNTDYDVLAIKLNKIGTVEWQKNFGGTYGDEMTSVQQTSDGGYILGGSSASNDGNVSGHQGTSTFSDYWVIKINNIGTIEWQKSFGGINSDVGNCIKKTPDGGYVIVGSSNSTDGDVSGNHGDKDYWVLKINNIGTIQWQKSLGGTSLENASCIQTTKDSGYIISGSSWSNDGNVSGHRGGNLNYDFWLVKLNSIGNVEWQKCLGGSNNDLANSIQQTNDLGYIAIGNSNSKDGDLSTNHGVLNYNDIWVVKLSSDTILPITITTLTATNFSRNIKINWQSEMETNTNHTIIQHSVDGKIFTQIGSINTIGYGANSYEFIDYNPIIGINYYRLKCVDKDGSSSYSKVVSANFGDKQSFSIIPNPARDFATISFSKTVDKATITVYDIVGKVVITQSLIGTTSSYKLNTQTLTNGFYVIKVKTASGIFNQTLIINK